MESHRPGFDFQALLFFFLGLLHVQGMFEGGEKWACMGCSVRGCGLAERDPCKKQNKPEHKGLISREWSCLMKCAVSSD